MTRPTVQGILAFLVLGVFVFASERTSAGPDKIAFPENYKDGVLYATIDRHDVKQFRELYGTEDAVKAARIPSGSVLTLDVASAKLKTAVLLRGQSAGLTFKDAGVFDYACALHSGMKGTVEITK